MSVFVMLALLFSFTACSAVPLLKGSDFSPAYKSFITSMCKNIPVSVEYEQFLKPEGFSEEKLVTDTDTGTIRQLVEALAEVEILEQAETASNFAVKHYTFTDKKGEKFTFEFYGSYLKADGKFYKTENSRRFISIRIEPKADGDIIAALDEAYDGVGEYVGKRFISCRELEQKGGEWTVKHHADYELSPEAVITAPTDHEKLNEVSTVTADTFFVDYESVKGQDNEWYVFKMKVEKGVIVEMEYVNGNLS